MILRVLDDVAADTVVTFGPDGMTGHPDHIAVWRWATTAAEGARHRPRLLYATKTVTFRDMYADLHRRIPIFGPDGPPAVERDEVAFALELRGATLDRKIAALSTRTRHRPPSSSPRWGRPPIARGLPTSTSSKRRCR